MSYSDPGAVEMLPGAGGPETAPPIARFDARTAVRRARLRADLYDLLDLAILFAVNVMFLWWEAAHVPMLSRDTSLLILLAVNGIYVISWLRTRYFPKLKARRVASTWSPAERSRFGV